jgi:hypothetical protein
MLVEMDWSTASVTVKLADLNGPVLLFLCALAFVGASHLLPYLLRRKRARAVEKLAQRYDLRITTDGIHGHISDVPVEVMRVNVGAARFIAIANAVPEQHDVTFEADANAGGLDQTTGDDDFDRRVHATGDRRLLLALLGSIEREEVKQAIHEGWTFRDGRWSKAVRDLAELERALQRGVDLARTFVVLEAFEHDLASRLEALFRTDPNEATRVSRLQILIADDAARPTLAALIDGALDDRHESVRLVAADHRGDISRLTALFCNGLTSKVRSGALDGLLRHLADHDEEEWKPVVDRLSQLSNEDWLTGLVRHKHIGLLVSRAPFPGRLGLARLWLGSRSTGLFAAGCAVVANDGDRDDLVRMRSLDVATSDKPTLEAAIVHLRARLEASGATGGGLALSEDGGGLALAPQEHAQQARESEAP